MTAPTSEPLDRATSTTNSTPTTRPISAARLAANRANAQKSTGPRTEAGKAISRLNGLTHGFAAATAVLPGENAEELQARVETWFDELDARSDTERTLVETAVHAAWRVERCRKAETAALSKKVLLAGEAFDADLFAKLKRLTGTTSALVNDGQGTVYELRGFSLGCRWLIEQWENIGRGIIQNGRLDESQIFDLLQLQGLRPTSHLDSPVTGLWLSYALASHLGPRKADPERLDYFFTLTYPGEDRMAKGEYRRRTAKQYANLPERADANAALLAQIEAILDELKQRLLEVEAREEHLRELTIQEAAFDASNEGMKRQRYELGHQRVLLGCLKELRNVRKDRVESDEPTASPVPAIPEPAPAPTEPKPEAPSEPKLEAPTEPRAAAPTEPKTAAPTEPKPVAPSEPKLEAAPLAMTTEPADTTLITGTIGSTECLASPA